MKRVLIYLMLMASVVVFAQTSDQPPDAEPGTGQPANPAEPGDNAAGDTTGSEDSPLSDSEINEQNKASDEATEEAIENNEAEPTEVAGEVEIEFDPDEEISEDYPVPLPSDI